VIRNRPILDSAREGGREREKEKKKKKGLRQRTVALRQSRLISSKKKKKKKGMGIRRHANRFPLGVQEKEKKKKRARTATFALVKISSHF